MPRGPGRQVHHNIRTVRKQGKVWNENRKISEENINNRNLITAPDDTPLERDFKNAVQRGLENNTVGVFNASDNDFHIQSYKDYHFVINYETGATLLFDKARYTRDESVGDLGDYIMIKDRYDNNSFEIYNEGGSGEGGFYKISASYSDGSEAVIIYDQADGGNYYIFEDGVGYYINNSDDPNAMRNFMLSGLAEEASKAAITFQILFADETETISTDVWIKSSYLTEASLNDFNTENAKQTITIADEVYKVFAEGAELLIDGATYTAEAISEAYEIAAGAAERFTRDNGRYLTDQIVEPAAQNDNIFTRSAKFQPKMNLLIA